MQIPPLKFIAATQQPAASGHVNKVTQDREPQTPGTSEASGIEILNSCIDICIYIIYIIYTIYTPRA